VLLTELANEDNTAANFHLAFKELK